MKSTGAIIDYVNVLYAFPGAGWYYSTWQFVYSNLQFWLHAVPELEGSFLLLS